MLKASRTNLNVGGSPFRDIKEKIKYKWWKIIYIFMDAFSIMKQLENKYNLVSSSAGETMSAVDPCSIPAAHGTQNQPCPENKANLFIFCKFILSTQPTFPVA